ncbi:MAG: hypothetical protein ABSF83_01540 [Nitrososphaerales archaeon]
MTVVKATKKKVEKLKDEIPAMTWGRPRWQLTFSSGDSDVLKTSQKVSERVKKGGVLKIRKGYALSVLDEVSGTFKELQPRAWRDVTSEYV